MGAAQERMLGKRVIVLSNEKERETKPPLRFGTLVGFEKTGGKSLIPVVNTDYGETVMVMGPVLPDTPEVIAALIACRYPYGMVRDLLSFVRDMDAARAGEWE